MWRGDEVVFDVEGGDACGYSVEELAGKVREALWGTSNRSAPGPDGISYRFIKLVLDTKLGEEMVGESSKVAKGREDPRRVAAI